MSYLLRVSLPDVPGALGAVATALGGAQADIQSIEIVERQPDGTAVDDVLLDLPTGVLPDAVVSACQRIEGVRVLWISQYPAGGSLSFDLEAVELLTQQPERAVERLVDVVPTTFRCDWAMVVSAGPPGAVVEQATVAAPALPVNAHQPAWLPLRRPARLDVPVEWSTQGWGSTDVAGVPLDGPRRALVLGRVGGPAVLDSELARLAHLSALAVSIAAAAHESAEPAETVGT